MGTGRVTYNAALAAVFIEGFIFIIVTLLGVRRWAERAVGSGPCP